MACRSLGTMVDLSGANVRVRLDRVVVDRAWRDLFSNAMVHHLISS
jgi:hypothetical protein